MKQLLIALSIAYLLNGLAMLATPLVWYQLIPGVIDTGPANIHFIRDIGLAFVGASTTALLIFSTRYKKFALVAAPVIFVGGHGAFHLIEMLYHQPTALEFARDIAMIIVPAILFCALLLSQNAKMEEAK